jgi:nicotinate phosphoribosyltransferase
MNTSSTVPWPSPALWTDLYELTMAYGYWKSGTAEKEAAFNLLFRKHPFRGGFTIACGLEDLIRRLLEFRFEEEDLRYLATLKGADDRPLFAGEFLEVLRGMRFACDVDAVPEGTIVFPHEPLVRVQGPIMQAQIIETLLLNLINFETLIATKAARVCLAAQGEPVLEFGFRRAQGVDGALTASRAAYIGGCAGTSNVLAGKVLGIPVKGTHAHSWVMSFDSELEAFEAYAEAMPNNCIFLVDTYHTLDGVRKAVQVAQRLRGRGHEMIGIRLDSGDLAYLSIEARKILDAGGFPQAVITASNDLDEHIIRSLKEQEAKVSVWGVGTKLVTAYDEPALGGVYKLVALRQPGEKWQPKIKLSEQAIKTSIPGRQQVRRFKSETEYLADMIYDIERAVPDECTMADPFDATRRKRIPKGTPFEDLLVPVFRAGRLVYRRPSLDEIRQRVRQQLDWFHPGGKRFMNPHQYAVGLELGFHETRTELILQARGKSTSPPSAE